MSSKRRGWLVMTALAVVGCDPGSTSFTDPTGASADCIAVEPNYAHLATSAGPLMRWERFPIRVSVDTASLALAADLKAVYLDAIMDGLQLWPGATADSIGRASVTLGEAQSDLRIRLGTYGSADDCDMLECWGDFGPDQTEFGRFIRKGTITLYPQAIRFGAGPAREVIARLVGHEMGHALGLGFHSDAPTDVMWSRPAQSLVTPWISSRDVNTMLIAYCR
jgi:predicted Zn-dependent protease